MRIRQACVSMVMASAILLLTGGNGTGSAGQWKLFGWERRAIGQGGPGMTIPGTGGDPGATKQGHDSSGKG